MNAAYREASREDWVANAPVSYVELGHKVGMPAEEGVGNGE